MNQADVNSIVLDAVQNQLAIDGVDEADIGVDTVLLGSDAVVDSLGLVNIIIEVEQVLGDRHGEGITLVDEKAMSARNSPFRTVGSLAEYAHSLVDRTEP